MVEMNHDPARHPLTNHPRAVVTPQAAFHLDAATDELQWRSRAEIIAVLSCKALDLPVNPKVFR